MLLGNQLQSKKKLLPCTTSVPIRDLIEDKISIHLVPVRTPAGHSGLGPIPASIRKSCGGGIRMMWSLPSVMLTVYVDNCFLFLEYPPKS